MQIKRLWGTLVLALGLLLAFQMGLNATQAATAVTCDRFVLGTFSGDAGNDCSDQTYPCGTVQHAINQAVDGDTICVARHTLIGPLVYLERLVITKPITLDGAWDANCVGPTNYTCSFWPIPCDPANVTLDAEGLGRVISITNANPTIQCFTITGGDAGYATDDPFHGGGIAARNAAPLILNTVITGNYGCTTAVCLGYGRGGGISLVDSPATAVISGNVIAHNVADDGTWGQGGGIYLRNASAQVVFNTVHSNRAGLSAGDGGGIAVFDSSPTIADNRILTNTAGRAVLCNGGGIFVWSGSPVTIERNLIQHNVALREENAPEFSSQGGGIYFSGPFATIRDNEVYGNVAVLLDERGRGGGMFLHNLSEAATVTGNIIANDNRASYVADGHGGGIYLDACYATVANNQVFDNIASSSNPGYGGGIYISGGGGLIRSNVITRNLAVLGAMSDWGWGGGMMISDSTALVEDNWIAQNASTSAPNADGVGGGVYVLYGAPHLLGNHILSNTTNSNPAGTGGVIGLGGGLYLEEARPWVDGNTIQGNRATGVTGRGGGVRLAFCPAFTLTNNIVARNSASTTGSGIAIALSTGRVDYNTIAANLDGDGVGVHVNNTGAIILHNNIIVSQTVGITNATPSGSVVSATHTLFEANGQNYGPGVTSADEVPGPAALLPDYRLSASSNAINNAIPLPWVTRDIDGDPRPIGPAPDVGADEYVRARIYLPLVLRNA